MTQLHRCPHCGGEFESPKPPPKPYEYTGEKFKPVLPIILTGLRSGKSPSSIAIVIGTKHDGWGKLFSAYLTADLVASITAIGRSYGLIPQPEDEKYPTKLFEKARKEHAWLLRAEGLTFKAIGKRLGVSIEQARSRVYQFGRVDATRAMHRTRFIIDKGENNERRNHH